MTLCRRAGTEGIGAERAAKMVPGLDRYSEVVSVWSALVAG
jgi:hypothetical protein